jgi:hypothetical protein
MVMLHTAITRQGVVPLADRLPDSDGKISSGTSRQRMPPNTPPSDGCALGEQGDPGYVYLGGEYNRNPTWPDLPFQNGPHRVSRSPCRSSRSSGYQAIARPNVLGAAFRHCGRRFRIRIRPRLEEASRSERAPAPGLYGGEELRSGQTWRLWRDNSALRRSDRTRCRFRGVTLVPSSDVSFELAETGQHS